MDSTKLFTNKAESYSKYRPSYPQEFIEYLFKEAGFNDKSAVADIGAGTGILTRLLAERVGSIKAVEPNSAMRGSCEEYCKGLPGFAAVDGSAENTTLPSESVDFITVAQAFHWFDRKAAQLEFKRILKPGGRVVLVWNSKVPDSGLIIGIDSLSRRLCPTYKGFSGGSSNGPDEYSDFFKNGRCDYHIFDYNRELSLEAFIGATLSASYAPSEGSANYEDFVLGLKELFREYSSGGLLTLPNKTHSYMGEV